MLDDLMTPPQMSEKTKDLQGISFNEPRKVVRKPDSEPHLNQIKDVQGVEQWRVDQIGRQIIQELSLLSDDQRLEILSAVRSHWCIDCGRDQPMYAHCNCQNDE